MHTTGSQNGGLFTGVCKLPEDQGTFNPTTFSNNFPGMTTNSYSLNCYNGSKRTNGSDASYGSAMAVGDMIMMCLDMDNGAIWWGKNGVWFAGGNPATNSNAAFTGLTGEFVFACGISSSEIIVTNFGQKPFKYAPPDGFQPLNTANTRPAKVISRPDKFVGIATYTGNSTGQAITMGFKPDLLWIKSRTNSGAPAWMDSVRGSNKQLNTNNQNAQSTNSATAGVLSFNSKGFILGTESSATGSTNGSQNYVAWGWKAGGGKSGGGGFFKDDVEYASAAAAGLTGGDRSLSAASVNTKTGFSILKWTNGNTTSPASARVPQRIVTGKHHP